MYWGRTIGRYRTTGIHLEIKQASIPPPFRITRLPFEPHQHGFVTLRVDIRLNVLPLIHKLPSIFNSTVINVTEIIP